MSDEKNAIAQVMRVDDKDWFLQILVNIVNSGELSFGITLNVGGFLVTGQLVGGKAYFEGFGAEFAGSLGDSAAVAEVKAAFANRGEVYSAPYDANLLTYIHLKDARFYNTDGAPIPSNRGVWWRGRIAAVDGFSLGALRAEGA